ncbi:MAG TPA: IPT/TIG domain-containing protein [Thermoanaerobaculia bacterium]
MSRKNGVRSPWSIPVRSIFLASFALALLFAAAANAVTVTGKILAPDSSPVSNATISFQQLYQLPITTTSIANGTYSIDLTPGCWDMSVSDSAHGTVLYPGTIRPDMQVAIDVGPTGLSGVDLRYPTGHSVGGTFTASGPLPTALGVALLGEHGEGTIVQQFFTTATWSIPYVPDGKWVIAGTDFGFPTKYAAQYFSGARAVGAATVVNLTSNRSDINFSLESAATITGKLSNPGGGFSAGNSVYLYTRGATNILSTTTDASGNFTFSGGDLDPGYQGQIVAYGSSTHPFVTALGNTTGTFPVSAGDWQTAAPGTNAVGTIAGQTPGTVKGHVVVAGSTTPIPGISVTTGDAVRLYRLGFNSWTSQPSAADGSYEIDGIQPFHRYTVSPFVPNTSYYYDASPTKAFFDLNAEIKTGVDIPLTLGGKIGGTITKASDASPVAFATVQIRSDCSSGTVSYGFTGSDGKFTSPALAAGTYRYMVSPPANSGLGSIWNGSAATCGAAPGISVSAGATTTSNQALPAGSVGPTGHKVTGRVTDAGNASGLRSGFVEFYNTAHFYFASVDVCGDYEIDGVLDGTYDLSVTATGYRGLSQSAGLVMAGADLVKNFSLTKLSGGVAGHVTFGGKPVQGIRVCTSAGGNCVMTDSSGSYTILGLDTGTVNLVASSRDNFDYQLYDGKTTLATADAVAVTNGTISTGKDFTMVEVPADPGEPDDVGTPGVLSRPESDEGPPRLLPDAPQHRAIKDSEDSDWFQFNVTSGMIYKVTITAAGITLINPSISVFDGTTKLPDYVAAGAIVTAAGWTAPASGTRWIGLSSSYAGSYTIGLTVSAPGPPSPTVTSITPTSGPAAGGTAITITGTNFVSGATVKIGGAAATNVVFNGATSLTCKAPARSAGALYDVVVTNPSTKTGTLTKGWLADFGDVPQAYIYHAAIEKVFRAAITSGCGGGNYCPSQLVTRDQMAVFILRGEHGGSYNPPAAIGTVFSDVTVSTPFAKWMERFAAEGISTGCAGGSPPPYCPSANVTRDAMAKFLLLGKHGSSFSPAAATGTVFSDVHTNTFLAKWMEELKAEAITGGCAAGVPLPSYCPSGTVTRGEMAKFIRATFGL